MKEHQSCAQTEVNKMLVRTFLASVENGDFCENFDQIVDESYAIICRARLRDAAI